MRYEYRFGITLFVKWEILLCWKKKFTHILGPMFTSENKGFKSMQLMIEINFTPDIYYMNYNI